MLEMDSTGKVLARYTTGLGIDEWISRTVYNRGRTKTYYYHYDGLGSVVALTDERGNVVKRYRYSPFGVIVPEGMVSPYVAPGREHIHKYFPPSRRNTITYTGREYDPDSGLYFYRARYYDPGVGRFISVDPLCHLQPPVGEGCIACGSGISIGAPMWSHPYVYVRNNPVNLVDPWGEKTADECYQEYNLCQGAARNRLNRCIANVPLAREILGCISGCALRCLVFQLEWPVCFTTCSAICGGGFALYDLYRAGRCITRYVKEARKCNKQLENCLRCVE